MPLQNSTPVPIDALTGAAPRQLLPITYVRQEQSEWCWAACCQMVFAMNGKTNADGTPITQEQMASAMFGVNCAGANGSSAACDKGCYPNQAYAYYSFACTQAMGALPATPAAGGNGGPTCTGEIDAGRPVEVYYLWTQGNTHVALLVGYYDNGDFEVFDPLYGEASHSYQEVLTAYGRGSWAASYSGIGPAAGEV
jgi:hypothetical protein